MKTNSDKQLKLRNKVLHIISSCLFSLNVMASDSIDTEIIQTDKFENWQRASDAELAELRGGFMFANGMTMNIRVEKELIVNGVSEFYEVFQLASESLEKVKNSILVQNGLHNVAPELLAPSMGVVLQNGLDNQVISSITSIYIDIGNIKNMNLGAMGIQDLGTMMMPAVQGQ